MAMLQQSLHEPILTRQQHSVCYEIHRASQIAEAYKNLDATITVLVLESEQGSYPGKDQVMKLRDYLKAEALRILLNCKVPSAQP